MARKVNRRDFLKMGALAATATVVSGCTVDLRHTEYLESYIQPPEEGLPGENLWYASGCRQCPAGCGIIVRVSSNRARKIEGNPSHPINRGRLCARGQAALQELYDPDRLQNAVRQDGRGSLKFTPIYWENALSSVVDAIHKAGPGGVAFWGGASSTHVADIVSRFLQALGAPPPVFYSLGDELTGRQALAQASQSLFDTPRIPLFDVANADVVFSFASSFLETGLSPVACGRAYSQMRRGPSGQRGYLVQFESRFSTTAASADEWVPVRPGTEGWVALALGKIILDQNLGRSVAAQYAVLYRNVDVAQVAQASGVSADQLNRLARRFAQGAHPIAIPGEGLAPFENYIPAVEAVYALDALAGQLGQPGGVYLPPEMNVTGFTARPASTLADVQNLVKQMAAGQVKLLFVHGTNPIFELPGLPDLAQAWAKVPTVVSFSSAIDETAAQADVVLPDHTNLESWGYQVVDYADRRVITSLQPTMRPLYDTRATADVFLALAQQLGGSVSQALPWRNEVDFLKQAVDPLRGPLSSEVYWSAWRQRGGYWADNPEWTAPQAGVAFTKAVEIAPPSFQGDATQFPFLLHLYPSVSLFDGRGANKSWLQETPDPVTTTAWQTWIEISPATAQRLGLKDEDVVRVASQAGEVEAIVYTYLGLPDDVVAMRIGEGHEQYGRFAKGQGSNPLRLLTQPAGATTLAWRSMRVSVVPAGRQRNLARLESPLGVEYMRNTQSAPGIGPLPAPREGA